MLSAVCISTSPMAGMPDYFSIYACKSDIELHLNLTSMFKLIRLVGYCSFKSSGPTVAVSPFDCHVCLTSKFALAFEILVTPSPSISYSYLSISSTVIFDGSIDIVKNDLPS